MSFNLLKRSDTTITVDEELTKLFWLSVILFLLQVPDRERCCCGTEKRSKVRCTVHYYCILADCCYEVANLLGIYSKWHHLCIKKIISSSLNVLQHLWNTSLRWSVPQHQADRYKRDWHWKIPTHGEWQWLVPIKIAILWIHVQMLTQK